MAGSRPERSRALRQWVGLSVGLLAITALTYLVVGPPVDPPAATGAAVSAPTPAAAAEGLAPSEAITEAISHYERAIAELQAATANGSDVIEPATQAALLAESDALDRAIAESRRAVTEDPDSEPARLSLFEALRRKIAMLQATMTLINEMQQTGPANAVSAADTQGEVVMNLCQHSYHRSAVAVTAAAVLGWLSQPIGHAESAWLEDQQPPAVQGPPPGSRGGDRGGDRGDAPRPDSPEIVERETRVIPLGLAGLLELKTASGDITVTTGRGRDVQLEIVRRTQARTPDEATRVLERVKVVVDHQGDRATVSSTYEGGRWRDARVDVSYVVAVPAATRVSATSVSGHVAVKDVRGEVTAFVTSGSVTIERASAVSAVRTISGTITLTDVSSRGGITVGTVSGRVAVNRLKADRLDSESVSGALAFENVEASRVSVHALSGAVAFNGSLAKGGRYEFQSHSSPLQLVFGGAGYQLQASSFSGAIRPDAALALKAVTATPRALRATVGDGSATVIATTFSGDVVVGRR